MRVTFKRNYGWNVTAHSCMESDTWCVKVGNEWLVDESGNIIHYSSKDAAWKEILESMVRENVEVRYV